MTRKVSNLEHTASSGGSGAGGPGLLKYLIDMGRRDPPAFCELLTWVLDGCPGEPRGFLPQLHGRLSGRQRWKLHLARPRCRWGSAPLWLTAMAGIPIACVLHGYVGFLFGAIKANPWWSTALMPVVFLISAVASGIAALVVLYVFMCWRRGVNPDADCLRAMCRYLWVALVLAVSLEMLELGHMA